MTNPQTITTTPPATDTAPTTWAIDPAHTGVGFSVRHMVFATVRGAFSGARGTVRRDGDAWTTATIEAEVAAASVDTGVKDRDAHLRSPDFFDAETHPTLRIESRRIEPLGDDRYRMLADLTIRGVTRQVPFDVTVLGEGKDPYGLWRVAATAEAKINRKEFGLNWNAALEAGGVLVGDEVKVTLDVQAIKQA